MRRIVFLSAFVFATFLFISCCEKSQTIDAEITTYDDVMVHFTDAIVSGIVASKSKDVNIIIKYGQDSSQLDGELLVDAGLPEKEERSEYLQNYGPYKVLWYIFNFRATITNIEDGAKYYYQIVVSRGDAKQEGEIMDFVTFPRGPVDLDLPSGNLWGAVNIGADYPTEYGDMYAWGDSGQHNQYDWTSYKWSEGSYNKLTKYCPYNYNGYNGYTDSLIELEKEDDVAQIILGEKWRTPSLADIYELIEKCIWTEFSSGDVTGYIVSSKKDENNPKKKIFLPFGGKRAGASKLHESAGYYWTTSFVTNNYTPYLANCLEINRIFTPRVSDENRCYGLAIRPVAAK